MEMVLIPRDKHTISRKQISDNALKVLYRLNREGYEAYLVGGGVRDLLLGKQPKDFDVATNATPEQMRKLFRNCRLVGRRFRLAHVMFGAEIIEVATFRGPHDDNDKHDRNTAQRGRNGMLLRDNIFGSIEEDARRRDFTVNSLYYSVADYSVRDYVGGMEDLRNRVIRLIGDPQTRYQEDPVRMLRAVRFAVKLNMRISPETAEPISRLAPLLKDVPAARLFEESLKLLQSGFGVNTCQLLRQYKLLDWLFPSLMPFLTDTQDGLTEQMITHVLESTDARWHQGLPINPAFLFAAIFWYPQQQATEQVMQHNPELNEHDAFMLAIGHTLNQACQALAIPKRLTATMRDIWLLQLRMARQQQGKNALRVLEQFKFRAGYDLLTLRAKTENSPALHQSQKWWEQFQQRHPQHIAQPQDAQPQDARSTDAAAGHSSAHRTAASFPAATRPVSYLAANSRSPSASHRRRPRSRSPQRHES